MRHLARCDQHVSTEGARTGASLAGHEPVLVAVVGAGGTLVLLLLLGGDDGLEVGALPALLASVAIGGLCNLLGLVDGGLLDIGAVHVGVVAVHTGEGALGRGAVRLVSWRRMGATGDREIGEARRARLIERLPSGARAVGGVWGGGWWRSVEALAVVVEAALSEGLLP